LALLSHPCHYLRAILRGLGCIARLAQLWRILGVNRGQHCSNGASLRRKALKLRASATTVSSASMTK
jgi:hypothetical protein